MKKVNLNQIPWVERKSPKGRYHRFLRDVALAFEKPGAGPKFAATPPFEVELVRLPAGARNFPFHSHASEWEFYLIISGKGEIRAGAGKQRLKPGDCAMNPPGEAHQIINTGEEDLVYYVIANNSVADFYHYPDSDKWGFWASHMEKGRICKLENMDYFAGEE